MPSIEATIIREYLNHTVAQNTNYHISWGKHTIELHKLMNAYLQAIDKIAELEDALNALRIARKESSQAFVRVSYGKQVQSIFDYLDPEEE